MACLGIPDPVGVKVYAPGGKETFDGTKATEAAQARQVVAKLLHADAILTAAKALPAATLAMHASALAAGLRLPTTAFRPEAKGKTSGCSKHE
jgi:hypothetical protein